MSKYFDFFNDIIRNGEVVRTKEFGGGLKLEMRALSPAEMADIDNSVKLATMGESDSMVNFLAQNGYIAHSIVSINDEKVAPEDIRKISDAVAKFPAPLRAKIHSFFWEIIAEQAKIFEPASIVENTEGF